MLSRTAPSTFALERLGRDHLLLHLALGSLPLTLTLSFLSLLTSAILDGLDFGFTRSIHRLFRELLRFQ